MIRFERFKLFGLGASKLRNREEILEGQIHLPGSEGTHWDLLMRSKQNYSEEKRLTSNIRARRGVWRKYAEANSSQLDSLWFNYNGGKCWTMKEGLKMTLRFSAHHGQNDQSWNSPHRHIAQQLYQFVPAEQERLGEKDETSVFHLNTSGPELGFNQHI